MSEDHINPATQLQNWYVGLVRCFRKECAKLPEEKQKQIWMKYGYNPPCQIEVFWLSSPNWHLTVTTHFKDREDLEVTVNGPYKSNIFLDEAEKILSQPKWDRLISKNAKNSNPNHPSRYGEFIAQLLHGMVEAAKNAAFMDYDPTSVLFRRANSESESIEFVYGDRRSADYIKLVKDAIADITDQSKLSKKPRAMPKRQTELAKQGNGFGAYFLPLIIIGKLPELTISDRLHGTTSWHISPFDRKSSVQLFRKTQVIITNYGYVGVCTSDRELAVRILNTIMATFEMKGLEATPVRDHELSEIAYEPETLNITSFGYDPEVARNKPIFAFPNETMPGGSARGIEEKSIKAIIEAASKSFEDPYMAIITVHFGDMLAHFKNSEFPQAFITGWLIIEKHISKKWEDRVGSKRVSIQKVSKGNPTTDKMLKAIKPVIPSKNYGTFMYLKDIRNKHLHEDGQITRQEAQRMLDAVKNYILNLSH